MIPVDNVILVVESCEDIVIRFNGDPYREVSRSVPSQKGGKSAKCWTSENVSSELGIGWFELGSGSNGRRLPAAGRGADG